MGQPCLSQTYNRPPVALASSQSLGDRVLARLSNRQGAANPRVGFNGLFSSRQKVTAGAGRFSNRSCGGHCSGKGGTQMAQRDITEDQRGLGGPAGHVCIGTIRTAKVDPVRLSGVAHECGCQAQGRLA